MPEDLDAATRQALTDLGLAPGASATEIRHAFAQLALKHHPDHNQNDPSATARFRKLCAAYEVLTHPHPPNWKQPAAAPRPANGRYTWPPRGASAPAEPPPDPRQKYYPSPADLAWLRSPHPYVLEKRMKAIDRYMWIFLIALVCILVAGAIAGAIGILPHPDASSPGDTYPERIRRQMRRF